MTRKGEFEFNSEEGSHTEENDPPPLPQIEGWALALEPIGKLKEKVPRLGPGS